MDAVEGADGAAVGGGDRPVGPLAVMTGGDTVVGVDDVEKTALCLIVSTAARREGGGGGGIRVPTVGALASGISVEAGRF